MIRRSRVIEVFPNSYVLTRLAGSLLMNSITNSITECIMVRGWVSVPSASGVWLPVRNVMKDNVWWTYHYRQGSGFPGSPPISFFRMTDAWSVVP